MQVDNFDSYRHRDSCDSDMLHVRDLFLLECRNQIRHNHSIVLLLYACVGDYSCRIHLFQSTAKFPSCRNRGLCH